MMKRLPQMLAAAVGTVAMVAVSAELVTEQNVSTFYREFMRLTERPHLVAPLTAALCTTPGHAVMEREKQMTGPHFRASVHVYANPAAMSVIAVRQLRFPAGAIIVKEKLAAGGVVAGVGGMIKREAGYDASNGDWEYFYHDTPGKLTSGRIASCIECHRAAKATDHVYSVWALHADRRGSRE
jgi:hypothetical protein